MPQTRRHYSAIHPTSPSTYAKGEANRQDAPRLTHLTTSGSAHMVSLPPPVPVTSDGKSSTAQSTHKPPTHRIAIAISIVRFSSATPAHLITHSLNKKGDVLGVARIAGISGAKETSRLIPLCHNILISGVQMNVEVVEAGAAVNSATHTKDSKMAGADDEEAALIPILARERASLAAAHGGVVVTARVHTFGQTGVEMEALTAASVAGLTVYDMCKAVDKGMRMDGVRVVLKTGGRSGGWIERSDGVVEKQA